MLRNFIWWYLRIFIWDLASPFHFALFIFLSPFSENSNVIIQYQCYFPVSHHNKYKIEVELDFSSYVTKSDLKNPTGFDTSDFAKQADLASLKSEFDKLDIVKLEINSADLSEKINVVENIFA